MHIFSEMTEINRSSLQFFVLSKKEAKEVGCVFVKTLTPTDSKIARYVQENRVIILEGQTLFAKGERALSLKNIRQLHVRGLKEETAPQRALEINSVEEVTEEEFSSLLCAAGFNVTRETSKKEEEKSLVFASSDKQGRPSGVTLKEWVTYCLQDNAYKIMAAMRSVWKKAAAEDKKQAEAHEKNYREKMDFLRHLFLHERLVKKAVETALENTRILSDLLTH